MSAFISRWLRDSLMPSSRVFSRIAASPLAIMTIWQEPSAPSSARDWMTSLDCIVHRVYSGHAERQQVNRLPAGFFGSAWLRAARVATVAAGASGCLYTRLSIRPDPDRHTTPASSRWQCSGVVQRFVDTLL